MATYLYSRDSKDKVRVLVLQVIKFDTHYEIRRTTGLLGGKMVAQPVIEIHKGKVNRTPKEQAELEFRSIINKQRDKGYKAVSELVVQNGVTIVNIDEWDPNNVELIEELLPKGKTYAGGVRKVMLAKDPKTSKNFNWKKDWWVSKKLDGVRAGVYLEGDQLKAISRNGKDISVAFTKIFQSKKLKSFMKKIGEGVMIDGELYVHGKSLQTISGVSRLDDYDPDRHDELEFWIFDFADEERTAEERAILLNSLQGHFDAVEDRIRINSQVKLISWDTIKIMHDKFVQSGFEGAICRDASRLYGFGSRDDRMVKVKEFQDDEFEIIGISEGLRPEDMCFKCITATEKMFECKPMGNKALKFQYIRDIDEIVGKKLTVKFFNYTEDGIPFLPVGKCIRDYE